MGAQRSMITELLGGLRDPLGGMSWQRTVSTLGLSSTAVLAIQELAANPAEFFRNGPMDRPHARHAMLTLELLSVRKDNKILDIGAMGNIFVRQAQAHGYKGAKGIDRSLHCNIEGTRHGRRTDLFELPEGEMYDVIHFRKLLDYASGGGFEGTERMFPIEKFAQHITLHLKPGGLLIFQDVARNMHRFIELLNDLGFERVPNSRIYYYVFRLRG